MSWHEQICYFIYQYIHIENKQQSVYKLNNHQAPSPERTKYNTLLVLEILEILQKSTGSKYDLIFHLYQEINIKWLPDKLESVRWLHYEIDK